MMRWLGPVALVAAAACAARSVPTPPARLPSNTTDSEDEESPSGYPHATDPVSERSIEDYVRWKFPEQIAAGQLSLEYHTPDIAVEVQAELADFGIATLGDLDAIVPEDFIEKAEPTWVAGTSVAGLVRDLMMIHDMPRYFRDAWKREHWDYMSADSKAMLRAFGIDMSPARDAGLMGVD